ncbi:unnamed protein product [Rhizophagus irregularis]|nr:unnamed protein product [Rhizophagus irregularis]
MDASCLAGGRDGGVKISTAINLIDSAIILHNYLELSDDIWEEQDDFVNDNDNNKLNNYDNYDEELKRAGEAKREWVMRKLFASLNNR